MTQVQFDTHQKLLPILLLSFRLSVCQYTQYYETIILILMQFDMVIINIMDK